MWSDLFRGPAWIIILIIVVLLFGAPRLPALARSIGQSMKIFRNEVKTAPEDDAEVTADAPVETKKKSQSTVQKSEAAKDAKQTKSKP